MRSSILIFEMLDPKKVWESVGKWQEKAMQTNQSLLQFAQNTKNMLEEDIMSLEEQIEDILNEKKRLIQKTKELEVIIIKLKRELLDLKERCKKMEDKLQASIVRMKKMEQEFKIRTKALRDELKALQLELSNVSAQLHMAETGK